MNTNIKRWNSFASKIAFDLLTNAAALHFMHSPHSTLSIKRDVVVEDFIEYATTIFEMSLDDCEQLQEYLLLKLGTTAAIDKLAAHVVEYLELTNYFEESDVDLKR